MIFFYFSKIWLISSYVKHFNFWISKHYWEQHYLNHRNKNLKYNDSPPQKQSSLIIVLPRRELLGPLTYWTAGLSKVIHCKTDNRWKNWLVSCSPYRTRTPKYELKFRSLQKRKQSKVRQGLYCQLYICCNYIRHLNSRRHSAAGELFTTSLQINLQRNALALTRTPQHQAKIYFRRMSYYISNSCLFRLNPAWQRRTSQHWNWQILLLIYYLLFRL